jgi:hypothetical protein
MRRLRTVLLLARALLAPPPANGRQFVVCPIVRDTKTQPCRLAAFKGEVYFLGLQGGVINDFYPPQLRHEVLVECTIVGGPRACGRWDSTASGQGFSNPACNTMLPAEDAFEAPSAPPPACPAPSWVKIDGPDQTTLCFDPNSDSLSRHTTAALRNIANLRQTA